MTSSERGFFQPFDIGRSLKAQAITIQCKWIENEHQCDQMVTSVAHNVKYCELHRIASQNRRNQKSNDKRRSVLVSV